MVTPLLEEGSVSQKKNHDPLNLQKSSFGASQSIHMEGGLLNKYFCDKGYAKTTSRQKKEFPERMIKH